jgi:acyl-CoA dehydrogenase
MTAVAVDGAVVGDLRAATRELVERELWPIDAQIEAEDRLPEEVRQRLAQLGYFGLTIPREYGGAGLGPAAYCAIVEELGRAHSAVFGVIDDNNGMGSHLILRAGTEEQRRRYLPDLASGRAIASFALTEPEAGSDAGAIRTFARRDGDSYVLNGHKHFISNAGWANTFTVITRATPNGQLEGRPTAFVVERGTPGFSLGRRQEMMGLRGTGQHELFFEDCRVPVNNRLGVEGDGLRVAGESLSFGRLMVAAWSLGAAQRALELGTAYAATRVQFGQVVGRFQGVQWLIADSATELAAARALLRQVANDVETGVARRRDAAMVKLSSTETAGRVADRMLQIHGGTGYAKGSAVERIYRDVRVQRIIEGTSEIQRMIIARSLLREAGLDQA